MQVLEERLDIREIKNDFKIKEEIERTDKEIDERVFRLYNLSEEEIGIVEKL